MQGFFRTCLNQNWKLDYMRLMDSNFEDYGIKLWCQKIKKNELKQKTKKNNKSLYKKHSISHKIIPRNFSIINLMATNTKKKKKSHS